MKSVLVILVSAMAVAKLVAGAGPPGSGRGGQPSPPNGYIQGGAQYGQVNIAPGNAGNNQANGQGQFRGGGATYAGVTIAPGRNSANAGGNSGNRGSGPVSVQTPRFP